MTQPRTFFRVVQVKDGDDIVEKIFAGLERLNDLPNWPRQHSDSIE